MFKPGDKVMCIEPSINKNPGLEYGKIYTIKEFLPCPVYSDRVKLEEITHIAYSNLDKNWFARRFISFNLDEKYPFETME